MENIRQQLAKIAIETLHIEGREDLDAHRSDSEDFLDDIAVWNLEEALIKAYELGKNSKS